MRVCVRVFSVGFGPGLDSMSPARSRRSASHAAGTHGWLPQKTGRPGLRRGGVGGYNLHSVPPDSPPDCGTPTTSRLYPFGVMAYADDITITSTHTSQEIYTTILNPDKTTCTLFTPDPAEYTSNLDLKIHNKSLPMATHPKVLGLTLDPKLTYSTHIHNISVHAHKS